MRSPSARRYTCVLTLAALLVLVAGDVYAASLSIAWDANPEWEHVLGYVVYVGRQAGVYDEIHEVGDATEFTLTTAEEGATYYFAVVAYNDLGDGLPSVELTVTDPHPALTSPGDQVTTIGSPVRLSLTAADPAGAPLTFAATLLPAGLAIAADTGEITGVPTEVGASIVSVTATAQNGRSTTRSFVWVVEPPDPQAPSIAITFPTAAPVYTANTPLLAIAGVASDDVRVARVTWVNGRGGSGVAAGSSEWSADIPLQPGINLITVTAHDSSGHSTSATLTVSYATGAPSVAILIPTGSGAYTTNVPVLDLAGVAAVTDAAVSAVQWTSDRGGAGSALGTSDWVAQGIPLLPGVNVISVTAVDEAQRFSTAQIAVLLDTGAPQVTLSPGIGDSLFTNHDALALRGSVTDAGAVVRVEWSNSRGGQGTALGTTTWSILSIPLQSGENVLTITAVDAAGNRGTRVLRVTSDRAIPEIVISAPAPGLATTAESVVLEGTASDDGSIAEIEWFNDNGDSGIAEGTTNWRADVKLSLGANVITVIAIDDAGNAVTTSITLTHVDVIPPTVAVTAPTAGTPFMSADVVETIKGVAYDRNGIERVSWVTSNGDTGFSEGTSFWVADVPLQPGPNWVVFTAHDHAGHATAADPLSIFVDRTPPEPEILSPRADQLYVTGATEIALAGVAGDNVGIGSIAWATAAGVSGVAAGTTTWTIPTVLLVPGLNVITITARDTVANRGTIELRVLRDVTAPGIAITGPSAGATYATAQTTVALSGTATDDGLVAQVAWSNSRGGSGTASGTTTWTIPSVALASGVNVITVTARDSIGHTATATISVTRDSTAPVVTIVSPTTAATYLTTATSVTFSGTANDNPGVTQLTWSNNRGGSGVPRTFTNWSVPNVALQPGENVLTITARDAVGNTTTATLRAIRDVSAPAVTVTAPVERLTAAPTVAVSGDATDDTGVVRVRWTTSGGASGVATGTAAWTIAAVPLLAGPNVITVTAEDALGTTSSTSITIVRDLVPPAISIVTPLPGAVSGEATIAMAGIASDDRGLLRVTWKTDAGQSGVATGTGEWAIDAVPLQPGLTDITVTAIDQVGNSSDQHVTVRRDMPPTVTITGPSASGSVAARNAAIVIDGIASDDDAVTEVRWSIGDHEGIATGTTTWTATVPLIEGINVITVTAIDSRGHTTNADVVVTRDATAPTLRIVSPAGPLTTSQAGVAVAGTASDDRELAVIRWSTSAGETGVADGTTNWSIPAVPLSAGSTVITVTAEDAVGNVATAIVTVLRDVTPPAVTVLTPAAGTMTAATTQTLTGTAEDAGGLARIRWRTDRGAAGSASGTSTWTAVVPVTDGATQITVTAEDVAGNVGEATLTVIGDGSAPELTIAPVPAIVADATLALSGAASDDRALSAVTWAVDTGAGGAATGTAAWTIAGVPLTAGANVITVTAVDAAGNTRTASVTVLRDLIAPSVVITSPVTGATYGTAQATVALSGTASDDGAVVAVTWSNSRGGSGTATGTGTWTIPSIALLSGTNVITVTARDSVGHTGTATLTVTRDSTAPVVTIVAPTTAATYVTTAPSITFSGTANDNPGVTQLTWSNSRGGSGVPKTFTNWSVPNVALQPGENVLTVTARDAVGNTTTKTLRVTRDVAPPTVSIATPADGASTAAATVRVTGQASDDSSITQVRWATSGGVSGVATGTTSWTIAEVPLIAGTNVIKVIVEDAVGNTSSTTVTMVRDVVPPVVTIISPATGITTRASTITVAGTATDDRAVAEVTWATDAGASGVATGTTSWTIPDIPLVAGPNVITVTAVDAVGNTTAVAITVARDSVAPVLAITSPAPNVTTAATTITLTGTADDNGAVASVTWTTDAAASGVATGTTAWTIANVPLVPGLNVITVTAVDAVGNAQITSLTVRRDASAPGVTITSPVTGATYGTAQATVALSGTASDDGAVVAVTWSNSRGGSGTAIGTDTWTIPSIALLSGTNVITVTARDSVGHTGTATLTVTRDSTAPVVTIVAPTTAATYVTTAPSITVSGTANDNPGVTQLTWSNSRGGSGVPKTFTNWSVPNVALQPGENVLTVTARDAVGNTTTKTLRVTRDVAPPTVSIATPADGASTAAATVRVTGQASDDSSIAQVRWATSGGASGVATGTTSWTIAEVPLLAGTNVITVTAEDAVGSTSSTAVTMVRDVVPPVVTIASPAPGTVTAAASVTLAGQAEDTGSVVRVTWRTDGGATGEASGTSVWAAVVPVAEGTTQITVTAQDAVGNLGEATLTVVGDRTPPTLTIAPGPAIVSGSTLTLSGEASDIGALASVQWTTDAGASGVATGTTAWTIADLPLVPGLNVITVTAVDAVGNAQTASVTVRRDAAAPVVAIAAPVTGPAYGTAQATVALSGTAGDDGAVVAVTWSNSRGGSGTATGTGTWTIPSVALLSGANVITVTARDSVGLTGTATLTVTRDSTAPVVTIVAPTTAATYVTTASSITFSGTANDSPGVTQLTWSNSRGGSGVPKTFTNWSVPNVALQPGENVLTITARDAVGNTTTRTLTVVRE